MAKVCSTCGENKQLSEFFKDRTTKDGHGHSCKKCSVEGNKEYLKAYAQRPKGRYITYRSNAVQTGRCMELTFEQFAKIIEMECFYCGETKSNGVDRVENDEGYTLKNSVACCRTCNWFKNKMGVYAFINHANKITDYLKRKDNLDEVLTHGSLGKSKDG